MRVIEGFDHACCWVEQWPQLYLALKAVGVAYMVWLAWQLWHAEAPGPVQTQGLAGSKGSKGIASCPFNGFTPTDSCEPSQQIIAEQIHTIKAPHSSHRGASAQRCNSVVPFER